jgi:hypothetical protein
VVVYISYVEEAKISTGGHQPLCGGQSFHYIAIHLYFFKASFLDPRTQAKNDMHSNTDTNTEIPTEQCHTDTDTGKGGVWYGNGMQL